MESRNSHKGAGSKKENAPESTSYPADTPGMTYHEALKANDPQGDSYPDKPKNHTTPQERLLHPDNGESDQK